MPDREELLYKYRKSLSLLPVSAAETALAACRTSSGHMDMPQILSEISSKQSILPFLPELSSIEAAVAGAGSGQIQAPDGISDLQLNPTLKLLDLKWKGLASFFSENADEAAEPQQGNEFILVFKHPEDGRVVVRSATSEDLLLIKMAVEDITPEEIARIGSLPVDNVYAALDRAASAGYMPAVSTLIRRNPAVFRDAEGQFSSYLQSRYMTLQWHVTQSCDLHCRHCYDRSDRASMNLGDGLSILDDFQVFCRQRRVRGQISFSGGNPLLYPNFTELYRAAAERGFVTAILGNPCAMAEMEELISIQMPSFFQVSLEGLQEHNDNIRGKGHFERVIAFLAMLRELGVYSMVMLTLTKDNIDEVIRLAAFLRGKTDTFNFNRLAMVGEGSNLRLPSKQRYRLFLEEYLTAASENPVLGIKDNLINILHKQQGREFFGGCTGFGCGAAFNFMSVLPDGEAHACRKFPSPIGNILRQGIAEVYDSISAEQYRAGSSACSACSIRPVCGGCLAVVHGHGMDVFRERDPYCFLS